MSHNSEIGNLSGKSHKTTAKKDSTRGVKLICPQLNGFCSYTGIFSVQKNQIRYLILIYAMSDNELFSRYGGMLIANKNESGIVCGYYKKNGEGAKNIFNNVEFCKKHIADPRLLGFIQTFGPQQLKKTGRVF